MHNLKLRIAKLRRTVELATAELAEAEKQLAERGVDDSAHQDALRALASNNVYLMQQRIDDLARAMQELANSAPGSESLETLRSWDRVRRALQLRKQELEKKNEIKRSLEAEREQRRLEREQQRVAAEEMRAARARAIERNQ